MNNKLFPNKRVLVLGSSGGIGSAIAHRFLEEGALVTLHGRDKKKLGLKVDALKKSFSQKVDSIQSDISTEKGIKKLISLYKKKNGKALDVLVISVGNGKVPKSALISSKEWMTVFNQNFFSVVESVSACMPLLRHGKNAAIVLIGSIAGIEFIGAPAAYASAKAALASYAKHLSVEVAKDNVRVSIVHPGNVYFEGGRWEELLKENEERISRYIGDNVPQGRFGVPEEIAEAVVFLASHKSLFTTGAHLVVDGGQHNSLS